MKTLQYVWVAGAVVLLVNSSRGQLLPDLVPTAVQVPASITGPPNMPLRVAYNVSNQGNGPALGYWTDILFLSPNPWLDGFSAYLDYNSGQPPLEPGENYWNTNRVMLPVGESGSYYLILSVDHYNSVEESASGNNQLAFPFTFRATPADLTPITLIVPGSFRGPPRPYVPVVWGVTNQGAGAAYGQWYDVVYFSTNSALDGSATQIQMNYESTPVAVGGVYWRTNSLRLPVTQSGTYYLFLKTDSDNSLHESDTNNNVAVASITVTVQPPDLVALDLQVPAAITSAPNPLLTVVYGVTNVSAVAVLGEPTWYDSIYLSDDAQLDPNDRLVLQQYEWQTVPPGGSYWRTTTLNIPVVTNGTWYLILKADSFGSLGDPTPDDTVSVPVTFTILPPDLVPLAQAPAEVNGPPYPYVTVAFGSTNQGVGAAQGAWSDYVYFSTTPSLDSASVLESSARYDPLPPGSAYWQTNSMRLPVVQDGTYYLIFSSDPSSLLYESDRSNNIVIRPITVHIQRPDLAPIAFQLPDVVTSPPNPEITFVWGVTNQGVGPAIGNWDWTDEIFVSSSPVWDGSATNLRYSWEHGPVAPGEAYWRTNTLRLPIVTSGTYYFFLRIDHNQSLIESDEENNVYVAKATFTIQSPDLAPLVPDLPPTFTGPPNPNLTVVWGVTNTGPGLARPFWQDAVFFSKDPVIDWSDTCVGANPAGPLAAGANSWHTNALRVPVTQSGTYYLIFKADSGEEIYEANRSNNIVVVPVTFTVQPPDLVPELQAPAVISGPPNPTATLVWRVQNQGIGPAEPAWDSWLDEIYLSKDSFVGAYSTTLVQEPQSRPIAPGESYWRTNTVRFPMTKSGNRYLILQTDSYNSVFESDEGNNTAAVLVRFEISRPDLAPLSFVVPSTVTGLPNPTLTFIWGVTNQGAGLAEPLQYGSWADRVYLATNNVFDEAAVYVGELRETKTLAAGGSYWRTNQFQVPVLRSGTYYLFFITDSDRAIYESDFNNNGVGVPVAFTIIPPDLAVISLQVPSTVSGTPRPPITVAWGVTNAGPGAAKGSWRDVLYLSRTPTVDNSTPVLGEFYESGPVQPGESYWRTNTRTTAVVESGTYYLIFTTDALDELHESDLNNNTVVVPVTFQISPPDLVPFAIQVPREVTVPVNPSLTVIWGITNQGAGSTPRPGYGWYDRFTLCKTPPPAGGIDLGSHFWSTPLGPGESGWATNTFRFPLAESGTYCLVVDVNWSGDMYESSYTNNQYWVPITFHIQPPDLAPVLFRAPAEVTGGLNPQVKLTWGITYQGPGTARGYYGWSDRVFLSRDAVLDYGDTAIAYSTETGPVTPGGVYWRSQTVSLPVTESGSYYLILSVDDDQVMSDLNYSNNTAVVPIHFNIEPPDLAPLVWNMPTSIEGSAFPEVTLIWGTTNQGIGRAVTYSGGSRLERVYLADGPSHSWTDRIVCQAESLAPLAPGESEWRTNTVQLPVRESGNYFLVFETDSSGEVGESCETNNDLLLPVSIQVAQPDLAPVALQAPLFVADSAGPTLTMVYGVTNSGPGTARLMTGYPQWLDELFLCRTNVLDGTEALVAWGYESGPVPSGGSYWRTNSFQAPVRESGSYYLILKINTGYYHYNLEESDYSNNVAVVGPISFEIQPTDVAPIVSLVPSTFSGAPYSAGLSIVWGVTNEGPGTVQVSWLPSVYWSATPIFDQANWVDSVYGTPPLKPGEVFWITNRIYPPVVTNGLYYLFFSANPDNELRESNTNNDVAMVPIGYTVALPDLAPVSLIASNVVSFQAYPWIQVAWGVTNQGAAAAEVVPWGWPKLNDVLYLSKSTNLVDAIPLGHWPETNSIPPGGSYWRTHFVRLPGVESGDYFLIFVANESSLYYGTGVAESDPNNNVAVLPITLDIRPPDLAPLGFQAPSLVTGQPYPEVTVVWGVTNQGLGAAESPLPTPPNYTAWPLADAVFLSTEPTIDVFWARPICGYWQRAQPFLPGTSEWHTNTVRVPVSESGSYYLVFKTDAYDSVFELDEGNNTMAVSVTFRLSPPADLSVSRFIVPRVVTGPGNPTISVAWQVGNEGIGPVTDNWSDMLVLSGPTYSGVTMGTFWVTNSLRSGESYWRTNLVTLPITESGEYQLTLRTGDSGPFDLDWNNNTLTAPITFNITGPPAVFIADARLVESTFAMFVYGALGTNYQLQASSDLVHWNRVLDFVCTYDPTPVYELAGGNFDRRFYRVAPVSEPAALRLDFAPRDWAGDGLWLKLDGPVGANYRIEASSDLAAWTSITNLQTLVAPMYFRDTAPALGQRFYRAVRE